MAAVSTVKSVAKTFLKVLTRDEEKLKDTTRAEELIRGITFDKFDEKMTCKLLEGIRTEAFKEIIEALAARFQLDDELKNSIIRDTVNSRRGMEVVREFSFNKGKEGDFIFGRIATVRQSDSIDMAYSFYKLVFKISPKVIEHSTRSRNSYGLFL